MLFSHFFAVNIVIMWTRVDSNAVIAVGDNIPMESYKQR
jgi:hypothetical protein